MLTYERVVARTSTLLKIVTDEYEGERRRLLHIAINSVIVSAEAGLDGHQEVLSPGQLKHWLERKIKAIHESFDNTFQEGDSSALTKRTIAHTADSVSYKRQKVATAEEQDIAAALLELARPSNHTFAHEDAAARCIGQGRKTYTAFPTVGQTTRPEEAFLAGVRYALQNAAAGRHNIFDEAKFRRYVSAELGLDEHRLDQLEHTGDYGRICAES